MTNYPTDGVKETEWVSVNNNRCRNIIICEPEFNLRGLLDKIVHRRGAEAQRKLGRPA